MQRATILIALFAVAFLTLANAQELAEVGPAQAQPSNAKPSPLQFHQVLQQNDEMPGAVDEGKF